MLDRYCCFQYFFFLVLAVSFAFPRSVVWDSLCFQTMFILTSWNLLLIILGEICNLFWLESSQDWFKNDYILSIWGWQLTNQHYSLDCNLELRFQSRELSLSGTLVAWVHAGWISWGLCHCIERVTVLQKTEELSEVFGGADQQIPGCPGTCGSIHILARTWGCIQLLWGLRLGSEEDKDWTHIKLKEILCHKHSLSHWQVQCLWMTCLTCIWILFSSLPVLNLCCSVLIFGTVAYLWDETCFFLLSSIKRLKGNLKRSICTFIWLAQLIFSLTLWASNLLLGASLCTCTRSLQGESHREMNVQFLGSCRFPISLFSFVSSRWCVCTMDSWASCQSVISLAWWISGCGGGLCFVYCHLSVGIWVGAWIPSIEIMLFDAWYLKLSLELIYIKLPESPACYEEPPSFFHDLARSDLEIFSACFLLHIL